MDSITLLLQKYPNQPQKLKQLQLLIFTVIFWTCKPDKQYSSMEKNDIEIIYTHSKIFSTLKK